MTRNLTVPKILTDAMSTTEWPKGRVPGARLESTHSIFQTIDFELLQTAEQLQSNGIAHTGTLIQFANKPSTRDHVGLGIGSDENVAIELPRLDVEQILVFGGGADIGDDFWLTLDFRSSAEDPRVVGNQFRPSTCEWFVIADTFRDFCNILGIPVY